MSGGGDDEDFGAIAWPGFVDILSNTIIMFIFFVLIVASALYFHILIFKSQILSEVSDSVSASSKEEELASTNRALMEKIKELEENAKVLEETPENNEIQLFQENTQFAESEDQKIQENEEEQSLLIFFGSDSISVTEENEVLLIGAIHKYEAKYAAEGLKVKIISGKSPKALNDIISRKLALARMLNVRNAFLNSKIPANQIVPSISEEEIEGTHNWVRVIFEKK